MKDPWDERRARQSYPGFTAGVACPACGRHHDTFSASLQEGGRLGAVSLDLRPRGLYHHCLCPSQGRQSTVEDDNGAQCVHTPDDFDRESMSQRRRPFPSSIWFRVAILQNYEVIDSYQSYLLFIIRARLLAQLTYNETVWSPLHLNRHTWSRQRA